MKYLLISSFVLASSFLQTAEASCEGKEFTAKDAAVRLSTVNAYFVKKEYEQVKRIATELEENLACMRTPAPPQVFATAYRYIGIGHYLRDDTVAAQRWFRSALELNPNHKWGVNEVSSSDELYALYEGERENAGAAMVSLEGKRLVAPEGTLVYLDGRIWKEAAATPNRPHILFIASASDRHIISRYLIEGNDIPELILQKGEPAPKKKKKNVESDDMFAVQEIKRVRPPSKTPLLLSSVATMAVAGGLYGYTFSTNASFYDATTTEEKRDIRSQNNSLIVTSIAIGTVGLGVGYAGVMVDAPTYSLGIPWQL